MFPGTCCAGPGPVPQLCDSPMSLLPSVMTPCFRRKEGPISEAGATPMLPPGEIGGALLHHTAELLLAPLSDRDEVDDGLATLDGPAQRRSVGHLALDELAASGFEALRRAALGIADETADRPVLRAQREHDLRPDEPGPTRDQNHACDYRRPRLP